jgi:hypothetical protein
VEIGKPSLHGRKLEVPARRREGCHAIKKAIDLFLVTTSQGRAMRNRTITYQEALKVVQNDLILITSGILEACETILGGKEKLELFMEVAEGVSGRGLNEADSGASNDHRRVLGRHRKRVRGSQKKEWGVFKRCATRVVNVWPLDDFCGTTR